MRRILVVLLILLVFLLGLPVGMAVMSACPDCTAATGPCAWGGCAAIPWALALLVSVAGGILRAGSNRLRPLLLAVLLERPPQPS